MGERGISFGVPTIELPKLRAWKSAIVAKLTGGLKVLAQAAQGGDRARHRAFRQPERHGSDRAPAAPSASASSSASSPPAPRRCACRGCPMIRASSIPPARWSCRRSRAGCWSSAAASSAWRWRACIDALGTRVSVVELTAGLMPGCDPDLVRPLEKRIRARYEQILTGTKVTGIEAQPDGLKVSFAGEKAPAAAVVRPRAGGGGPRAQRQGHRRGAAGVTVSERGFIPVDKQMRTNVPHIFAIGDIAGAAACWRTRRCTRARWPPRWPPATRAPSMRA